MDIGEAIVSIQTKEECRYSHKRKRELQTSQIGYSRVPKQSIPACTNKQTNKRFPMDCLVWFGLTPRHTHPPVVTPNPNKTKETKQTRRVSEGSTVCGCAYLDNPFVFSFGWREVGTLTLCILRPRPTEAILHVQ